MPGELEDCYCVDVSFVSSGSPFKAYSRMFSRSLEASMRLTHHLGEGLKLDLELARPWCFAER